LWVYDYGAELFITLSTNLKVSQVGVDQLLTACICICIVNVGAETVIGWARSHYLSSATHPSVKGDKLVIPRERYFLSGLGNRIFGWTLNVYIFPYFKSGASNQEAEGAGGFT
jgi:hypothetical protein